MKPGAVQALPFFFFLLSFFLLRAVGGVSTAAGGGGVEGRKSRVTEVRHSWL